MFDLTSTHDGEDVRDLLHDPGDRNCEVGGVSDARRNRGGKCVPEVMLFAPTSAATFSRARHTLRSDSVRFQSSPKMERPPSLDAMRLCSSASLRILPPERTFQGENAIPTNVVRDRSSDSTLR